MSTLVRGDRASGTSSATHRVTVGLLFEDPGSQCSPLPAFLPVGSPQGPRSPPLSGPSLYEDKAAQSPICSQAGGPGGVPSPAFLSCSRQERERRGGGPLRTYVGQVPSRLGNEGHLYASPDYNLKTSQSQMELAVNKKLTSFIRCNYREEFCPHISEAEAGIRQGLLHIPGDFLYNSGNVYLLHLQQEAFVLESLLLWKAL